MAGPPQLTFTLDLEDHRPDARYPKRFPEVTRAVLATIEDCGVRGTVFVVGTLAEQVFLVFGMLIGIFGGPAQAASRTMLARLAPPKMIGEFYGLYALSGKATAFIAPLVIGIVTGVADSQRIGIATIVIFLVVGGLMMLAVREARSPAAG